MLTCEVFQRIEIRHIGPIYMFHSTLVVAMVTKVYGYNEHIYSMLMSDVLDSELLLLDYER